MRILYKNMWKRRNSKFSKDFTLFRVLCLSYEDMIFSLGGPAYKCDKAITIQLFNFEFSVYYKNLKVYMNEKEYKK